MTRPRIDTDELRKLLDLGFAVLGPHDDMPECVQRNLMVYVNMWQFRETLELADELILLRAHAEAMAEALEGIGDRHIPDCPAYFGGDEYDWVVRQYAVLRRIASDALTAYRAATKDKTDGK